MESVSSFEVIVKRRFCVALADPEAPTAQLLPVAVEKLLVCPAQLIVAAVTLVAAVPVLETVRKLPPGEPHVKLRPALDDLKSTDLKGDAVTATWAEFVDVPKTPNTNPAIAVDATNVTATISTVATIGEMALLSRPRAARKGTPPCELGRLDTFI